jgi:glycosyltransferase involved in cell wall biosynthesis
VRDAIVFSGWRWEAFNVPERLALALRCLGARVLYCENPVSVIRRTRPELREVEPGIFSFQPYFYGHRLNSFSPLSHLQTAKVAAQIFRHAGTLGLRDPLFFYGLLMNFLPLCSEMKKKCFLVHFHMDHIEWKSEEHVRLSDRTLAIPRSIFNKLKTEFGEKVQLIPQGVDFQAFAAPSSAGAKQTTSLDAIPRPRLGYMGPVHDRLKLSVLSKMLSDHPEWHFVSCGDRPALPLPNAHVIPWQGRQELPACVRSLDVGFMPYNCADQQQLHCVPLKLFEYFAAGIPVVSTPLVHLSEFEDVVYFGANASDLAAAVVAALNEPPDSPKRAQRVEFARSHSIECLAKRLEEVLPLQNG